MEHADFIVIGAGIAGASAAYRLARHGKVVVLETEAAAGYHTTGRSAALFTESFEIGIVRELVMASRSFLEGPPVGFADLSLLAPLPFLFIGREDQLDSLTAAFETGRDIPHVGWVGPEDVRTLCPAVRPGYAAGGVYEAGAMTIDVDALLQGYLRGVRAAGGVVRLKRQVTSIDRAGGRWLVTTGTEQTSAGVVVNAAGAWADRVGALAGGQPIGLVPMRRTAFTFSPPRSADPGSWPVVCDVDEAFYFKPEAKQLMGSLAEETPMDPHDVRPDEIDVALAIERIEAATSMQIRHVSSTWAGLRSFVADRRPVVGWDPDLEGVFWVAGQGGFGIMTSPAISRACEGLIVDGRLPDELEAFGVTAEALGPARLR
ncbi:MAG: FAD-binding oxidoreductase [Acidimicrobiia bacterium]|nr:FAD-binding oxidoreductase [Acidimicrobiia bacterium]